jgi:hypothetical protein
VTTPGDALAIWDSARDLIQRNEGRSHFAYYEEERVKVGVGFLLSSAGASRKLRKVGSEYDEIVGLTSGLSDEQMDQLFNQQLAESIRRSRDIVTDFEELTSLEQAAVVHFVFSLTPAELDALIAAASEESVGGWATTPEELGESRWYSDFSRDSSRPPR